MRHEPLASLDDLLAPTFLSDATGTNIRAVICRPFVGGHSASGSRFLAIETNDGEGPRFVVKRSSPATDWIVRGTGDVRGREVMVWSTGLLDRLPPEITHPVIACARDGEGWAILMHDVSATLIPDPMGESPIAATDHRRYLDALAALHTAFWQRPEIADPALGFCTPEDRYTVLSPATAHRERDHPNEMVRLIGIGWDALWTIIAPDVTTLLQRLLADPTPLCAAMARAPQTVIHGDPRGANLGITTDSRPRVVLLDWHLVGPGTPAVDLAWYLYSIEPRVPVTNETSIVWYREALSRRIGDRVDDCWWSSQLALGLLGEMVRRGWGFGWRAAHHPDATVRSNTLQRLVWWSEQARAGARWL